MCLIDGKSESTAQASDSCVCVCARAHTQLLSRVWIFETPWTVACQTPLCMEFSRQEYWNGLPFPTLGDRPEPGIKPTSLAFPALSGGFFTTAWEIDIII